MNRFEVANSACLGLVVLAVVVGAIVAGWAWWAVLLAAAGAFFGGGWVVEHLAPGTRLLEGLGYAGDDGRSPNGNQ